MEIGSDLENGQPSTNHALAALQQRVHRLERMCAGITFTAMAGGVAAFTMIPATPVPSPTMSAHAKAKSLKVPGAAGESSGSRLSNADFDAVTCRTFTVLDSNDHARVRIETNSDGTALLSMRDPADHVRFLVSSHTVDQTTVQIRDAHETDRVVLGTLQDGSSGIDVQDRESVTRITLILDEDGNCAFKLLDGQGNDRIEHLVEPTGNPISVWRDDANVPRLAALIRDGLGCMFDVNDEQAHNRVRHFAANGGRAGSVQLDDKERVRMFTGSNAEGAAYLEWWDTMERRRLLSGTVDDTLLLPLADSLEVEAEKPGWASPSGTGSASTPLMPKATGRSRPGG